MGSTSAIRIDGRRRQRSRLSQTLIHKRICHRTMTSPTGRACLVGSFPRRRRSIQYSLAWTHSRASRKSTWRPERGCGARRARCANVWSSREIPQHWRRFSWANASARSAFICRGPLSDDSAAPGLTRARPSWPRDRVSDRRGAACSPPPPPLTLARRVRGISPAARFRATANAQHGELAFDGGLIDSGPAHAKRVASDLNPMARRGGNDPCPKT